MDLIKAFLFSPYNSLMLVEINKVLSIEIDLLIKLAPKSAFQK